MFSYKSGQSLVYGKSLLKSREKFFVFFLNCIEV